MKKKFLMILLTVFMVFALVACGKKDADICGTWALEYDGSEQLSAQIGTDVTFVFNIMMEFNSDNTMRMYVDANSLKDSVSTSLMPVLVDMMYAQMGEMGLDKEAADEMFQQSYGKTIQEYCETELFSEENLNDLTEDFNTTGRYKIKGDKLYLTGDEDEFDDYVIFSLKGDTLTMDDPSGAEEIEGLKLPLVLKRQ